VTEFAWFAALCDDDYEFLGVPDTNLQSSWEHCRNIVLRAERNGFDNILLPSGYALGIDATAFASAIAVETTRIKLLLAVRLKVSSGTYIRSLGEELGRRLGYPAVLANLRRKAFLTVPQSV
jgi:hypothetical protein